MSEEPKDSSAPKQVDHELSGLEPQELLYALGVDFDIDAQLAAIHGLLRRNRGVAAEIEEEIKSAEDGYWGAAKQKTGLRNPVVFLPENYTIRGLAPCV